MHKITFIIGELHCQCPLIYRKLQVCSNINYFDIAIIKAADLSNDKLQTETLNLSKHLQRSFPHGAKLLFPSYVLPRENPCTKYFNLKDICYDMLLKKIKRCLNGLWVNVLSISINLKLSILGLPRMVPYKACFCPKLAETVV